MVCNYYGNVLIKYLQVKLFDNFEKVFFYYQEVLSICMVVEFFVECCLILLNYLNVQWYFGMEEDKLDESCYQDMVNKVEEVIWLIIDDKICEEVVAYFEVLQ